jgi:energy-coupling factor transport system ATP-binding protein
LIDLKNLNFGYSSKSILKNLNLSIKDGESVLLLGISGSGKSTLLKCMSGVVPNLIDGEISGQVIINDLDTKEMNKIPPDIGIVLQDPETQFVCSTAGDEIAFGLENLCYDKKTISKLVKKFAKRFKILDKLDKDINSLSYGEKKKVIIAAMAAMDKKIILMDEPLTNLDVRMKEEILFLLKELKKDRKTIIVAEQNPCIIKVLFDRCIVLDKGNLIYDGEVEGGLKLHKEITNHPKVGKSIPTDDILLEVKDLSFSYGKKKILKKINLKVKRNEIVAITGENGSGKTTLALCLCNLLKKNKGNIQLLNKNLDEYNQKEIAKKVGFVFQNPNFQIFNNTIVNEIEYGPKNFGMQLNDDEKNELLKISDLNYKKNSHPFSLSLGEKRRLNIASVLSSNPDLLILDEPVFGQDPYHFSKILRHMVGKKTIILITHEDSLLRIANRVFYLKDGMLVNQKCSKAM